MWNKLIRVQRYINLSLFTIFVANIFIAHKADALNPTETEIYLKYSGSIAKKNTLSCCGNILSNYTPKKVEKFDIGQNLNPEPIRVFPNINIPQLVPHHLNPNNLNRQLTSPDLNPGNLEDLILNSLTNSYNKYPWIVSPTDNLSFSILFNPSKYTNYTDFSFNLTANEHIIDHIKFAHFPKQEQFYWLLPGNRIVIETRGWQSGILDQGQSTEIESRQLVMLTQKLWGMQAVSLIPQAFKALTGETDINRFSIQSIAAEVNNPVGSPTPKVIINSGNSNSLITNIPRISNFGTASTYNPRGGGALFELLDADNAPLILQSFPTSNLQPLLAAGNLTRGTVIPQDVLAKIGFAWGNIFTGERTRFQPQITSKPGIKVAQGNQFDNWELLNILINPFIGDKQRDLYYLNSLYWVHLGQRVTNIRLTDKREYNRWQRFYFSYPHNRILLKYDPDQVRAIYTNVFSNPGISLSLSIHQQKIDELQTANATLGMLMGGIFELIHPPQIGQSLQIAKQQFSQQKKFADLQTTATPEQIAKINQLLNRTLLIGNRNSGLEQVSGTLTFPSIITLNNSNIFQIRTGNYRRTVRFIDTSNTWSEGQTFISKAEISNKDFGNLTFIGVPIPIEQTSIRSRNRTSAAQVNLINSNGQQFVQNWSSTETTEVPMNIRSFALAFDHLEFSKIGQLLTKLQSFQGYLSLPAIESLWSGASGKWNYSVNSGVWFNLNSDSAFNVIKNNFGFSEPTLGIYVNGALNYVNTHVEFDANSNPKAIISNIPALRFSWNSASNSQNPSYLNFTYFFSHQTRNFNYSLAPTLILVEHQGNLTTAGFLQTNLSLNRGLELSNFVEISNQLFYKLMAIQKINQDWYIGGYLQNFREINQGFKNRTDDFSYGLIIKHHSSDRSNFYESQLSINGGQFELRIEGGWQF